MPTQVKNIFTQNKSVSHCNARAGKLLYIPLVNTPHFGTKSLTYKSVSPYNTRAGKLLYIPHVNMPHFGAKSLRYILSNNKEECL